MNITIKFPLGSTQHFLSMGVPYPMRVVGHYITDMGRESLILISDEGIPNEEIQPGEAVVVDTLYITGQ